MTWASLLKSLSISLSRATIVRRKDSTSMRSSPVRAFMPRDELVERVGDDEVLAVAA